MALQVLPPSGEAGAYWPMGSEVVASAKIPDGETIVAVEYPNPLEVRRNMQVPPGESPPGPPTAHP